MMITNGTKLGRYEIRSKIGAGAEGCCLAVRIEFLVTTGLPKRLMKSHSPVVPPPLLACGVPGRPFEHQFSLTC